MSDQHPHVDPRSSTKVWRQKGVSPLPAGAPDLSAMIVIVGTGPIGLALAIELGQRGHDVVVLGKFDFVPAGSKAICLA